MYNIVDTHTSQEANTFCCPVTGDGRAKLKVGRKKFHVIVRETSIKGFTVEMKPGDVKRILSTKSATLAFDDRRVDIEPESTNQIAKDKVLVRFALLREHAPKEKFRLKIPFFGRKNRDPHPDVSMSVAAYGGVVLVLFCVLAMPGLGDHLGTAPRIEAAVKTILQGFDSRFTNFRR
ncbi:hypothetical protein [Stieleria varia]|uniref:Uncharacterized protein n=1 Tax=Stieleria varia TaxID=2528005 RepID=A0A5C6A456_9BACT|nr:hypothetical protein [Stieleria varia]TWT93203.1 hypothetical protein Pla52n_58600 [Stieleria varia]